jgi:hypothetical protein
MSVKCLPVAGIVGGVIGLATLAAYLAIIVSEGDDSAGEVVPWAAAMALAGTAAVAGSLSTPRRHGQSLLRAAAVGFIVVGLLAIFSIGLPLLIAGVLCLVTSEGSTAAQSRG